jgi:putative ABC transport system permease protein
MGPSRLLLRAGLRHLLRRPWLALLPLFGVALGVALVLAVELANRAALSALAGSVEALAGRATHRVVGGANELPEGLWGELLRRFPALDVAPVLERDVLLADRPGEVLRCLGVDPLSAARLGGAAGALASARPASIEGPLDQNVPATPEGTADANGPAGIDGAPQPNAGRAASTTPAWIRLLGDNRACLLARSTAQRLGLIQGKPLALRIGTERAEFELVGLLDPRQMRGAGDALMIVDIAAAQERFQALGRLTRLELILPPGAAGEALAKEIQGLLPSDARLEAAAVRSGQLQRLTAAFRQNLIALAGLSLFVGAFLITNAVRLSVVERRALLARLAALGATRGQLLTALLGETLLLGTLGSALGLLLGKGLAELLYRQVSRTISDLYTPLLASGSSAFGPAALLAFLLGLSVAIAAALPPALEAARAAGREAGSRSGLEQSAQQTAGRALWLGLVAVLLGALLLWLDTRQLWVSYAALISLLLGIAAWVPSGTQALLALLRRPFSRSFGAPGRLAIDAARRSLSRTGLAVAALMIALAATLSVSVLIASFRSSLETWLEGTLVADIYAAPPALAAVRGARGNLEADLARRLTGAAGVTGAQFVRQAWTPSSVGELELMAIDFGAGPRPRYFFLAGDEASAWEKFLASQCVFISEPLAFRHGLKPGDRLRLDAPAGPLELPIGAVLRDYGSERGLCWLHREAYVRAYRDGAISSLALWLAPGQDPEAMVTRLRGELRAGQELFLRSNRGLRAESLAIFERTFAVTALLRVLTLAVALVGTLTALLALALDRSREVALLRALGLTPGQLALHLGLFGAALGLAAGLFAAPVGALLASLMMGVVNRDSFGWTMLAWRFPPQEFALALGLAVLFASLAALASLPRLLSGNLARDLIQE